MSDAARKVLEEIQKAKSNALKQGPMALGLNLSAPVTTTTSSFMPATNSGGVSPVVGINEVHMSHAQRQAHQSLQQANASSFGYFISQESSFGNSILPVLPRFDNVPAK